jgi:hypothetical protein
MNLKLNNRTTAEGALVPMTATTTIPQKAIGPEKPPVRIPVSARMPS